MSKTKSNPPAFETDFSKAWKQFHASIPYAEMLDNLIQGGMKIKYAENILMLTFTAGWNAKDITALKLDSVVDTSANMLASQKLKDFCSNPTKQHLLNTEEYSQLKPYEQGYCSYMQASWEGSGLPHENPFEIGSTPFKEWNAGNYAAMIDVSDNP